MPQGPTSPSTSTPPVKKTKLAHDDVMAQPRRRGLRQRVALWITALVTFSGGTGFYLLTEGRPVSMAPLAFHLDEVDPLKSGIKFVHAKPDVDPFFKNVRPWLQSVSASACVCDVDRDGFLDLYLLTSGKGDKNKLYKNAGGFRFVEQNIPAIENLNEDGYSTDCIFADVDNDGFDDLLVLAFSQAPRLFRNVAAPGSPLGRTFVDVTRDSGLPSYMNASTSSFFDVENDGDLDLLISNFFPERYEPDDVPGSPYVHLVRVPDSKGAGRFLPNSWSKATNGGRKYFLLNDGTGKFTLQDPANWNVSKGAFTWDIGTGDINRDGYTDLYLANDFGPDEMLLNDKGRRFESVIGTYPTDVARDSFKGMNSEFADLNNDGYPEIYVTNVFHPILPEGNMLWWNFPASPGNSSARKFRNVAAELGVKDDGWGWGAKFVDLDLDTDIDLVATNGLISDNPKKEYWYRATRLVGGTSEIIRDSSRWPPFGDMSLCGYQVSRVFIRQGSRFYDRAPDAGVTRSLDGRGVLLADFDRDGRTDVVIVAQGTRPFVTRNRFVPTESMPQEPAFFGLQLAGDGRRVNANAVGSKVKLTASLGEDRQAFPPMYFEVSSGNGFAGQSMYWIAAGLGRYRGAVDVEIQWTDGSIQIIKGFEPGRYHSVVYGRNGATKGGPP